MSSLQQHSWMETVHRHSFDLPREPLAHSAENVDTKQQAGMDEADGPDAKNKAATRTNEEADESYALNPNKRKLTFPRRGVNAPGAVI